MAQMCNLNIQEAEEEGLQIQGHPELHSAILSQKFLAPSFKVLS